MFRWQLKGPFLSLASQPSLHDKRTTTYLQSISFISSIGFGLAVSAAITLGTASSESIFGSRLKPATEYFVAAATAYGLALVSSVASQAAQAFTEAPEVPLGRKAEHDSLDFIRYVCAFVVVWAPPMLIIIATLFVGWSIAVFNFALGCILQGGIVVFLMMVLISQRVGNLIIVLMTMVTLPLIIFFLVVFGPIKQFTWPIFTVFFGLLLLVACISAICQLNQRYTLLSTNLPPVMKDIEQFAGLDPSPEVPALPQQCRPMDLEAITTQLSSLVRAVEQLAAQNASLLRMAPTSTFASDAPVHSPDHPPDHLAPIQIDSKHNPSP